jgi:hypothetical protein
MKSFLERHFLLRRKKNKKRKRKRKKKKKKKKDANHIKLMAMAVSESCVDPQTEALYAFLLH